MSRGDLQEMELVQKNQQMAF